jgi:hypothetical protein
LIAFSDKVSNFQPLRFLSNFSLQSFVSLSDLDRGEWDSGPECDRFSSFVASWRSLSSLSSRSRDAVRLIWWVSRPNCQTSMGQKVEEEGGGGGGGGEEENEKEEEEGEKEEEEEKKEEEEEYNNSR